MPIETGEYVIKPGDNLGSIARSLNVPIDSLQAWNNIPNPDRICTDQTLLYRKDHPIYNVLSYFKDYDKTKDQQMTNNKKDYLNQTKTNSPQKEKTNSSKKPEQKKQEIKAGFFQEIFPDSLLARQMYAESRLDSKAISNRGAKGLAQAMPNTWAEYMKKTGKTKADPLNEKDAVDFLKWYSKDLLSRDYIKKHFDKNSEYYNPGMGQMKYLAAYNMGSPKLFDYLNKQKAQGVDIDNSTKWVDNLVQLKDQNGKPNYETRDYVKKIFLRAFPQFEIDYDKNKNRAMKYITGK